MEYKKEPAFINRQLEINYLKDWIAQRPEHLLFFYGPKSSGKTTLIYKFIEGFLSDESEFSVKLFNLREVLIVNYDDFLQRFFTLEDPQEKDSTQTRQYAFTLSESQIEYIWDHFGGSVWEVTSLLGDFLKVCRDGKVDGGEMEKIVERHMLQARSYFEEYAGLDASRTELLRELNKHVQSKGFVEELFLGRLLDHGFYADREALLEELNHLVRNNYLYYNTTLAEYKLQGKSMEIGLNRFLREIAV